jgi:biotin carboxyl carrier protein
MLQATTSQLGTFNIDIEKDGIKVANEPFEWDLATLSPGRFHILKDGRSYNAELVQADPQTKTYTIKINGQLHTVGLKTQLDLLLDKLGMSNATAARVSDIKAPMPGLIVAIKVEEGQTVAKGDPIMILEAMKMENILKSPGDGVVKAIKVKLRDNVEKGQVLIQF